MARERQSASLLEQGPSQNYMSNGTTRPMDTRTQRIWFYRAGHGNKPIEPTVFTTKGLEQLTNHRQVGKLPLAQLLGRIGSDQESPNGVANDDNISASGSGPADPGPSTLAAQNEDGTWWLDIESPTSAELSELFEAIDMHPLTKRDIQTKEPRDKCQRFPNYLFISFQSVVCSGSQAPVAKPIYLLVLPKGTISIHYGTTYIFKETVDRIKFLGQDIKPSSVWVACVLIDAIANAFVRSTQDISDQITQIKDAVSRGDVIDSPDRITICHQQVTDLLLIGLKGSKEAVLRYIKSVWGYDNSDNQATPIDCYISGVLIDVLDKIKTTSDKLQTHDRALPQLFDHVSFKKTDLTNRKLSALSWVMAFAVAFLPLNVITGLWGMNVRVPGQDDPKHDNYLPFFGILAALCLYGLIALLGIQLLFRRFDQRTPRTRRSRTS